jgi:hypothetical protein
MIKIGKLELKNAYITSANSQAGWDVNTLNGQYSIKSNRTLLNEHSMTLELKYIYEKDDESLYANIDEVIAAIKREIFNSKEIYIENDSPIFDGKPASTCVVKNLSFSKVSGAPNTFTVNMDINYTPTDIVVTKECQFILNKVTSGFSVASNVSTLCSIGWIKDWYDLGDEDTNYYTDPTSGIRFPFQVYKHLEFDTGINYPITKIIQMNNNMPDFQRLNSMVSFSQDPTTKIYTLDNNLYSVTFDPNNLETKIKLYKGNNIYSRICDILPFNTTDPVVQLSNPTIESSNPYYLKITSNFSFKSINGSYSILMNFGSPPHLSLDYVNSSQLYSFRCNMSENATTAIKYTDSNGTISPVTGTGILTGYGVSLHYPEETFFFIGMGNKKRSCQTNFALMNYTNTLTGLDDIDVMIIPKNLSSATSDPFYMCIKNINVGFIS